MAYRLSVWYSPLMPNPPPEREFAYFESGALIKVRDIAEINHHLYRVDKVGQRYADFVPMAGAPQDLSYLFYELEAMQRAGTFKLYSYLAVC